MPRPKGSKNKKTVEREREQMRLRGAPLPPPEAVSDLELPAATKGDFVEYKAPNGDPWRIEKGTLWAETFATVREDGTDWHLAFAAQDRGWHLLRLWLGVAPLVGETNPHYLRPHTEAEIAEKLALTADGIRDEVLACAAYWQKFKRSRGGSNFQQPEINPPVPDEKGIASVLEEHGFNDIEEPADRTYVANRINDLQPKLEDEVAQPIARLAIRSELTIQRYERMLSEIDRSMRAAETAEVKEKYRDEFQAVYKAKAQATEDYLKLMKSMDATHVQNPNQRRKVAFRDTLGQLVLGIQEYEANGDNTIIDGMFTEAEIEVQLRPMSLRPPQYRADIVALVNDAMKPHHFWDPKYVPPAMDRNTYRRFQAAWKSALAAMEQEQGVEPVEMEFGGDEEEDLPPPPQHFAGAPETPGSLPAPTFPARARGDGDGDVIA